jgi:hypothetical protein
VAVAEGKLSVDKARAMVIGQHNTSCTTPVYGLLLLITAVHLLSAYCRHNLSTPPTQAILTIVSLLLFWLSVEGGLST